MGLAKACKMVHKEGLKQPTLLGKTVDYMITCSKNFVELISNIHHNCYEKIEKKAREI
jgi:hypothetical protein